MLSVKRKRGQVRFHRVMPETLVITKSSDAVTAVLPVRCPLCQALVDHPGYASDGAPILAECIPCDLLFVPLNQAPSAP